MFCAFFGTVEYNARKNIKNAVVNKTENDIKCLRAVHKTNIY